MRVLTIRLSSPLQSYGKEAAFDRRNSNYYPTKSAIVGLIAAALGYGRKDNRIHELNKLNYAVRIEQHGERTTDFQIVEWKKGKRKLTYREYMQDAVYLIAIGSSNEDEINKIEYALKHPKYALFLGRRSNPIGGVLMISSYKNTTPISVLRKAPWQASEWYKKKIGRYYDTQIISDYDFRENKKNFFIKDIVESFDQKQREYSFRKVALESIKLENIIKNENTEHDALNAI